MKTEEMLKKRPIKCPKKAMLLNTHMDISNVIICMTNRCSVLQANNEIKIAQKIQRRLMIAIKLLEELEREFDKRKN